MNDPIISPWVVYLITRLDTIRDLLQAILAVCFASPVIIGVGLEIFGPDNPFEILKRCMKIVAAMAAVAGLSFVLLPTTKEAVMIYAAGKITPQTLQSAGNNIDKAIDKIVEKVTTLEKRSE